MKMGQWATLFTIQLAPHPMMTPMIPPVMLMRMASMRNWLKMSTPRAPTLMRRPISRVRSVTETYMMFMMPMPPTSSEMPATAASSRVIMSVVEVSIDESSCWERIVKSSSSVALSLWLVRRICVISSMAWSVYSSLNAEQVIDCRWVMARIRF